MKKKHLFLLLAIIGAFIPLSEAFPLAYVFGVHLDIFWDTYLNSRTAFLSTIEGRFISGFSIVLIITHFQKIKLIELAALLVGSILLGIGFSLPMLFYFLENTKRR